MSDAREKGVNMTLRESIMQARKDFPLKTEEVEFMGQKVWAREMTDYNRRAIEQARVKDPGTKKARLDMRMEPATVVCQNTFDGPNGTAKRAFQDGDELYIKDLPSSEVDRVFEAIYRLSGMTGQASEDAEKNSEPTTTSTSDAS